MLTNIGNTNQFGFKIIAKGILILCPHYTSDIENQANPKSRFTNMAFNKRGQMKMPKPQMSINYGRVVFVLQGNQINAKAIWI
jgi:hypothetical protein